MQLSLSSQIPSASPSSHTGGSSQTIPSKTETNADAPAVEMDPLYPSYVVVVDQVLVVAVTLPQVAQPKAIAPEEPNPVGEDVNELVLLNAETVVGLDSIGALKSHPNAVPANASTLKIDTKITNFFIIRSFHKTVKGYPSLIIPEDGIKYYILEPYFKVIIHVLPSLSLLVSILWNVFLKLIP